LYTVLTQPPQPDTPLTLSITHPATKTVTIAEHDKERGTRQKIEEPPTPYRYTDEEDYYDRGVAGAEQGAEAGAGAGIRMPGQEAHELEQADTMAGSPDMYGMYCAC